VNVDLGRIPPRNDKMKLSVVSFTPDQLPAGQRHDAEWRELLRRTRTLRIHEKLKIRIS
jgi:hypothetical protein